MYHIIINPASRSGKASKIWQKQIEPALQREDISYRAYFSQKAGDVARIARSILNACEEIPLRLIILG